MRRDTLEGLFYILLSALGYAAMPIWINYIYRFSEIQPLELFILRFGLAIPMMWLGMGLLRQFLPHLFPNEPLRRSSFLVVGLFISVASLSAFYALQNISAGVYEVLLIPSHRWSVCWQFFGGNSSTARVGGVGFGEHGHPHHQLGGGWRRANRGKS
ncbi:MAG UNVERIFIED_CONTAM: hypothetical protein LVT10_25645 [Anaerolineae bacterium]|jgi:hypothetical protein